MTAAKRDTKTALLQTALDLIWTQSYGSVSVDDICHKAKAKKGSFYHYFESKSELAKAAMDLFWEDSRAGLDQTFSAQHPPLERIRAYAESSLVEQEALQKKLGYVPGCPLTSIGSEQCSCDDGLSNKSKEILGKFSTYLRSAIQDAVTDGSIPPVDPSKAAAQLLTYELGALSLARVSNNLDPLRGLYNVWMAILGTRDEPEQVHAGR